MSNQNSHLAEKIEALEFRFKVENEKEKDKSSKEFNGSLDAPRPGSGRRPKNLTDLGGPGGTPRQIPKPLLDLPVSTFQQREPNTGEIDRKMQEIMKMTGILEINGKKYVTDIKELDRLGDLGFGTCGQVVKMLHKPSNTEIAVKVSEYYRGC